MPEFGTLWDLHPKASPLTSLEGIRGDKDVLASLNAVDWSFARDDTGYLSHDLHPYPAKFIPQLPGYLIELLSLPGEVVWDCFGGSGTTALEALRLGRRSVSTDANPLATEIARAKCLTLSPEATACLKMIAERITVLASRPSDATQILLRQAVNALRWVPTIPNYRKWFHPIAISELAYLLHEISQLPQSEAQCFARVCFSSILVRASYQDSETRYVSKPRDLFPGEVLGLFARALGDAIVRHEPLQHLLRYRSGGFATVNLLSVDAKDCASLPSALRPNSVDLLVTSPPYANAFDYHLYHRFRLYWLGFDPGELGRCEIGSHLRHQREQSGFDAYAQEMERCLGTIIQFMRPGRLAVFVVGDSIFEGKRIRTAEELATLASKVGWRVVGVLGRSLPKHKRSFIPAARRAESESLLVLRRPEERITVRLCPPPYKLWPYEQVLAKREVSALVGIELDGHGPFQRDFACDPYRLDQLRRLTFAHRVHLEPANEFQTWQSVLENGQAAKTRSAKKEPKYVTHGIHAYKGKFYPQLAKSLFNIARMGSEAVVLDPYCGSGTVLLEGQLNGLHAYGCDMNPLAVLIARAKTSLLTEDLYEVDKEINRFLVQIAVDKSQPAHIDAFPHECRQEIKSWFPQAVGFVLGWLLTEIGSVPILSLQGALKVCLSSIIREVSQQDPHDLRIRRRAEAIANAPALSLFQGRVQSLRGRLRAFATSASAAPVRLIPPAVDEGDNRRVEIFAKLGLARASVDLIVTSPPYATALPYIDTDRLSLLTVLGMDAKQRAPLEQGLTGSREIKNRERLRLEHGVDNSAPASYGSKIAHNTTRLVRRLNASAEVGFRRQNMAALLYRYFTDLYAALQQLRRVLRPGGNAFFVMGNNKTEAGGKEVEIDSVGALGEMGQSVGWKLIERLPITVTTENYKHTRNSITSNTILRFCA